MLKVKQEEWRGREREREGRKLKRKPTLFQDQFNVVDLNYEKIKRQKLLPIGGASLKRMEMAKNIDHLQREWQAAKQKGNSSLI